MLENTSKTIYENQRCLKLQTKTRKKLIHLVAVILSLNSIIVILLFQFSYYTQFDEKFQFFSNHSLIICNKKLVTLNIDLISTCFSLFLLICYASIYKRRIFLRNKIKCDNFGLPMIISCWKKVKNLLLLIKKYQRIKL